MNKLSIETKLFMTLFKLAQLVEFVLALIKEKLWVGKRDVPGTHATQLCVSFLE